MVMVMLSISKVRNNSVVVELTSPFGHCRMLISMDIIEDIYNMSYNDTKNKKYDIRAKARKRTSTGNHYYGGDCHLLVIKDKRSKRFLVNVLYSNEDEDDILFNGSISFSHVAELRSQIRREIMEQQFWSDEF